MAAKRNLALDFVKAPGHGIRVEELSHYCAWRGLPDAHKPKLHAAMLAMGAKLQTMRFWDNGSSTAAKFYMGIYWNHDEKQCPDLEELLKRDVSLFCSYNPFLEWQDDAGEWHAFSPWSGES